MANHRSTVSLSLWGLSIFLLLLQPGCVTAMDRRQIEYDVVQELAAELAASPFKPQDAYLPEAFRSMDYDAYRNIRFRPSEAIWLDEELPFQVQFFHRGYLFQEPVFIHEFTDTHVQEIPYVRDFFKFENLEIDRFPQRGSSYAGWRLHAPLNSGYYYDEVIAFLGASYFRSLGKSQAYGISARGLLLPHEPGQPEEFPRFVRFWLKKPEPNAKTLTAFALMDSPSLAGAYEFRITPGDTTSVDVMVTLYPRVEIAEVGLGALTSMFYYGENTYPRPDDFRPEVHDSDGLSLQYAEKDFQWRPLSTRNTEITSMFPADNLIAFGLHQRDRDFRNYLDGESRYEQRPSVRVRLGTGFNSGSVLLRELPPEKEFGDNIVAAYIPEVSLKAGNSYRFDFNMLWGDFLPHPDIAHIVQTRHGRDIRNPEMEIFMVEFKFPDHADLQNIESLIDLVGPAKLDKAALVPDASSGIVRAYIHVIPEAGSTEPVEISLRLVRGDRFLSEKWLYLWSRYN